MTIIKNLNRKKCILSMDHEKTSYVRSVGCYDVVWDDYDVDRHCDFVFAWQEFHRWGCYGGDDKDWLSPSW